MVASLGKVVRDIYAVYQLDYIDYRYRMNRINYVVSLNRKCLDLACDMFFGSLMSNYYLDEFATFNNYHNTIGYDLYDPLIYGDDSNLQAPIPIYQDETEKIGEYWVGVVNDLNSKDEAWVNDLELTLEKVVSLTNPFYYKKEEWCVLALRINMYERGKYDENLWNEHIDFWCCTDPKMALSGEEADRFLTIELKEYGGNIDRYSVESKYPYECLRVPSIAYTGLDVFDDTSLVLPPADIIKRLGLVFNYKTCTWDNEKSEPVIVCSNNKNSYYDDFFGSGVYIRKSYLDRYINVQEQSLKHFAFAEKYLSSTGYSDETSVHLELKDHSVVRICKSADLKMEKEYEYIDCKNCKYGLYDAHRQSDDDIKSKYEELIRQYGVDMGEYLV